MSEKHEVTIYTTSTCVYCKMAKEYFKENNVQYKEIDVGSDQKAAQEMVEKSGQLGVPVIDIDGHVIVGFDQPKVKAALGLN